MEDLRGDFTPDSESEFKGDTIFKIAAGIIVLLVVAALGAYYMGMGMLQNQPTRVALAVPSVPINPVIQPKAVAPVTAPAPSALNTAPSSAVAPVVKPLAQNVPTHVRKRATQQNADLQPAPAAPVEASPAATPPAAPLTADPVSTEPTPAPAAPAQPATQP